MTLHPSEADKVSQRISKRDVTTWKPILYRPESDIKSFEAFQSTSEFENAIVTDEIISQLEELTKSRHPRKDFTDKALRETAYEHIGDVPPERYGVWAYYPWSHRLVHLLDEAEFVEVRTNRNHYKITPEEHRVLATKKVGLVGLSVGQSVALTMAMERSFGELRLADFDLLELTNLNRIRTGVHNLGVPKVVAVAREIMEIDPYLRLKCFDDGLTEDNMTRFFEEGGKLDLLIDECDGLDIKVLGRWKARELGIPVVMEASDRGAVDVERFDLEPERPLLHGTIESLDPKKLKTLKTNEDKMPYMLDIVGIDTISLRAKASMLEIGETITTWPQLASAVTLGGGITADVVRRIFLGSYTRSGRYYVDVEELIGDDTPTSAPHRKAPHPGPKYPMPDEDFGPMLENAERSFLTAPDRETVAKAACHAPSGGNMQPWKWSTNGEVFRLKRDVPLTGGFLDHREIATQIALGASLENADLALKGFGLDTKTTYFPLPERKDVVADLQVVKEAPQGEDDKFLSENILGRHTNRNIDPGRPLELQDITYLGDIGSKHGSQTVIIEDRDDMLALGRVIAFAERFRIMHPEGHRDFNKEIRWTPEEARESGSGIDLATVDLTVPERAGFELAKNKEVIDKLVEWNGGTAFEKLSKKSTGAAAALGIVARPDHTPLDHLEAGRDMERVWIGANAKGISFQPQSPITLILQRLKDKAGLNDKQVEELSRAQSALLSVTRKYTSHQPVFIFRLFYGQRTVTPSMRRHGHLHFKSL